MIVMTNPMILITQTTTNGTRNGCHGKGNPPPLDEGDTSGRRGNMHINIYIVVENSGSCSTVGPILFFITPGIWNCCCRRTDTSVCPIGNVHVVSTFFRRYSSTYQNLLDSVVCFSFIFSKIQHCTSTVLRRSPLPASGVKRRDPNHSMKLITKEGSPVKAKIFRLLTIRKTCTIATQH